MNNGERVVEVAVNTLKSSGRIEHPTIRNGPVCTIEVQWEHRDDIAHFAVSPSGERTKLPYHNVARRIVDQVTTEASCRSNPPWWQFWKR